MLFAEDINILKNWAPVQRILCIVSYSSSYSSLIVWLRFAGFRLSRYLDEPALDTLMNEFHLTTCWPVQYFCVFTVHPTSVNNILSW